MIRHTVLATPTLLVLLAAPFTDPAAAETRDTVACYKAKDRAKHRMSTASVASADGVQPARSSVR